MRGDGWGTTRRRAERGDGQGGKGKRVNKRGETDKRRGGINSKVGEGAFSDEIRSRGRSKFGYLIHEGGKNRSLKGGAHVPLSPSSLLLPQQPPLQMELRGSRTSNGALFTPPPRAGTNWQLTELIQCRRESHVCARAGNACFARGRRLYLPREIASVPSLARPAIAYAVKPFFHYEIVTARRRERG